MILAYVAAMVVANLSVWYFGPWISPLNAFLFIGLDLTLRDRIHDRYRGSIRVMALVVCGASVLTYLLNPAAQQIAIASAVAFGAAAAADWLAYSLLRSRPYMQRVNGSNLVGAGVDSILFPTLAFGAFMPPIILAQFVAKVAGGALWSMILKPRTT